MFSLFCCCRKSSLQEPLLRPETEELSLTEELFDPKLPKAPPNSPRMLPLSQAQKINALHDYLLQRIKPLTGILYLNVCNQILRPLRHGKYHEASDKFCEMFHQEPQEFARICDKFDLPCADVYSSKRRSLR